MCSDNVPFDAPPAMHPSIVLAGNGSFRNHGCEAIARGTIELLRRTFGSALELSYAAHNSREETEAELSSLGYADVRALPFCPPIRRGSRPWVEYHVNRRLGTSFPALFEGLRETICEADAVLSIGGDNYSLDYGYPERFLQFDRFVLRQSRPLVYWCASVGSFSADPVFEQRMRSHLGRVPAILARESSTVAYLRSVGIAHNVRLVADPAFAMQASRPGASRFAVDRDHFVGVNFSTTVARRADRRRKGSIGVTEAGRCAAGHPSFKGSPKTYDQMCRSHAAMTVALMGLCDGNLVFVPHVTGGAHCDHRFMTRVADHVERLGHERPLVVPPTLTAPEYKWVISRARIFIGARTHATIAAFSSGVPTAALSYSLKAHGLTRDMYDSEEYCIPAEQVCPERIVSVARSLITNEELLRARLQQRSQTMIDRTFRAGEILAELLET